MSPPSTVTVPQAFALALQHHQAGRLAEAEALYGQILAAQPRHAEALHRLGVIAYQTGRLGPAAEWIRQSLVQNPNNPPAYSNLGEVYRSAGQLDEAITCYRRALQLQPDLPEVFNNLGVALTGQSRFDEAVAALQRAAALKPDYAEAHNNLGNALGELRKFDEAIAAYRRALQCQPDFAMAWNNLGIALSGRGQIEEAIGACRRALQFRPEYPEALNSLGSALTDLGRLDDAATALHRALQFQPGYVEAHYNLGNALKAQGQLDAAAGHFRQAILIKPTQAEFHNNLGNVLTEQGKLDEAIAAYRQAMELNPEAAWLHSNLICTLNFHPGQDRRTIAKEQQRWNQRFGAPLKRFIMPHTNDRDPERRLRIGYVSPDFRRHVVGMYLRPLFRCHDHRDFEVFCYSGVARPDDMTEEFRQSADHWRSTVGVEDEALAEMVRQDGVDILVDLSLHTAGNRLPMFARQPAPVQISFAGHPESTDLETIGYQISDAFLEGGPNVPTESKTEPCLIESYWCYDPCGTEVDVNALPAQESGRVTFGCLNNFAKINEAVLGVWAQVLGAVQGSRLLLLSREGSNRESALAILARHGVEAKRVEFVTPRPRREYLELYHRIDIALDPFPYNGHATSLDALWMGVPVVSLAGSRPVSRAGLSQLSHLGLPELAAASPEAYVSNTVQLARDLPRLAELRSSLRSRMEASPLMDAPRFARGIENAYRKIWRRWCLHQQP